MDDAPGSVDNVGMQIGFQTCILVSGTRRPWRCRLVSGTRRPWWCRLLAGTLALTACGSGPISVDDGADESGSGDGDGDGDGGEPEGLACADENGLVPGVLRLEGAPARAWIIDGDAELELALAGDDQAEWLIGAAAGDHIAIARIDGSYPDHDSIVQAFSRSSGEPLWTRELAGAGVQQLWVAEDGWLAGTTSPYLPGMRVGFLMSEQEAIDLPDHEPIAAPVQGHVAAYELDALGNRQEAGWINLADHSWQGAVPTPIDMSATVGEDRHTLEYLALVDGVPAFVRARPGEAEVITLPVEMLDGQSLYMTASTGSYRVLRRYDVNDTEQVIQVRVDVDAGEAVLINPEPPPGWSFFDCYDRRVSVDGEGRLYYELRNDTSARPWAYDVESDAWTQLGLELGLVDDIDIMAQSPDVMLVRGMAQFQTYCPPTEWAEPLEDALVGDSVQLVRREPALTMVLPMYTWQVLIDEQQRCAAVVGENGWEVRSLDGSDAVLDVGPGAGTWLWLD
jgi:hypothetical protein